MNDDWNGKILKIFEQKEGQISKGEYVGYTKTKCKNILRIVKHLLHASNRLFASNGACVQKSVVNTDS